MCFIPLLHPPPPGCKRPCRAGCNQPETLLPLLISTNGQTTQVLLAPGLLEELPELEWLLEKLEHPEQLKLALERLRLLQSDLDRLQERPERQIMVDGQLMHREAPNLSEHPTFMQYTALKEWKLERSYLNYMRC